MTRLTIFQDVTCNVYMLWIDIRHNGKVMPHKILIVNRIFLE